LPKLKLCLKVFAALSVFALLLVPALISEDREYIRLHIIANSDSYEDNELKESIRDALIDSFGKNFRPGDTYDTVKTRIIENLGTIEEISERAALSANLPYDVVAKFGEFEFPAVKYDNFVLPAGDYQALKVIIGNGNGSNWWCVMYPPLCLNNATQGTPARNVNTLNTPVRVEHRVGVVEWIRRSRNRLRGLFTSAERIIGQ